MKIGIVGHGSNKFDQRTERIAKSLIHTILTVNNDENDGVILVSGHSPMGGIDIWSEEIATALSIPMEIKTPTTHSWDGIYGYKARNLDIANYSDVVHIILVKEYPTSYKGRKFESCYHCAKHDEKIPSHVKSGGCWTGWKAHAAGKEVAWHIIK